MIYRTVQFHGVSLEIPEDFISPNWELVLNEKSEWDEESKKLISKNSVYQEYIAKAVQNKVEPLEPQPFITAFCKMLEDINMREGRNAEMWFNRLVAHNGSVFLKEVLEKMSNELTDALKG